MCGTIGVETVMPIKNKKELSTTPLRKAALAIAEAGLRAIDTKRVIKKLVSLKGNALRIKDTFFSLEKTKHIFIIGIGKCSLDAALGIEKILGNHITGGIVLDVRCSKLLKHIESYEGTHPLPTQQNVDVTTRIINLLKKTKRDDLVIMIISGGGSTLLCQPRNFECQNESALLSCLIRVGATIQEINTVRKHLSLARGGHLAQYAYPSRVAALIFSDIPGNDISFVASGPTVKDTTTIADAQRIFKKYTLYKKCDFTPHHLITTPKEEKYFKQVHNILAVSNSTALEAMAHKAKALGFKSIICTDCLEGEARTVGSSITRRLKHVGPKQALLFGGETTVTLRGHGKGGRNQELALAALPLLEKGQFVLSLASDGRDNIDVAGALVDIKTKQKACALELNARAFLKKNNSYEFFKQCGGHIKTGHTGSNVADLVLALKE